MRPVRSGILKFNFELTALAILRRAGVRLLAVLGIFMLLACSPSESQVILHTADGPVSFKAEVVDTQELRSKGLMFRQELAPNAGMLFDFQEERKVAFWMRNTFIPLDMIFVRADGIIANIHVNARPQDPTSIPSDGPVRFVFEIPGGRTVEIGLKAGDRLEHPRIAQ